MTTVPIVVEQHPYEKPCAKRRTNNGANPMPSRYSAEHATSTAMPINSMRLRPTRSMTLPAMMRAMRAPMMKMLAAKPAADAGAP